MRQFFSSPFLLVYGKNVRRKRIVEKLQQKDIALSRKFDSVSDCRIAIDQNARKRQRTKTKELVSGINEFYGYRDI